MKLLFLTFYYPPLGSARSIQLSRLVKYTDHDVFVVCADYEGGRDETISDGKDQPLGRSVVEWDQPFSRSWVSRWNPIPGETGDWFTQRLTSAMTRFRIPPPGPYRYWALEAAETVIEELDNDNYDVLVSFGQPMSVHLGALKVARQRSIPWVAHFSDPWVGNPYFTDLPVNSQINRSQERSVIAESDLVLFTNEYGRDFTMNRYGEEHREKTALLPHSFDPDRFPEIEPDPDRCLIRHVGHFYQRRSPAPFIRALNVMYRDNETLFRNLKIEFIGQLSEGINLPEFQFPDEVLEVKESVSYAESLHLMKSADILLVIDAELDVNVFFPSKLVDYLGAERPIVAITPEGPTDDIVRSAGGDTVGHENIDQIAELLSERIRDIKQSRVSHRKQPEKYAADRVAGEFDNLMRKLVEG